tara:strand:- start:101 stop:424 length:324 start_codon:yes stop_codon:yes gene_type:complete
LTKRIKTKSDHLTAVKSEIIEKLANNYPNFYKKDIHKILNILVDEIKNSLRRKERVELRDIFTLDPKLQKAGFRRNPKNNEKIFKNERYTILFKSSKLWLKKVNEEI